MVRREYIFWGCMIGMMLTILIEILIDIWLFPGFLSKQSDHLVPLGWITIMIGLIIPRYFSKKYNNWLETNPFRKNSSNTNKNN